MRSHENRLHYLSNLRAALTVLVICHHCACGLATGMWYYVVRPEEGSLALPVLAIFVIVNQSFFMSLFFFVSAYLTPSSYERKGVRHFLKDRFVRLGIPLLVYFFIFHPILIYLTLRFSDADALLKETAPMLQHLDPQKVALITGIIHRFAGSGGDGLLNYLAATFPFVFGTGPLWFVFALLVFALVYAAVRRFSRREVSPPSSLPTHRQIASFVITVGILTFLLRVICPVGVVLPVAGVQPAHFPLYICMYVLGVRALRGKWLDTIESRHVRPWFGLAVLIVVLVSAAILFRAFDSKNPTVFLGGFTWQAAIYAMIEPVLCVGICLKLLHFFREHCNRENTVSRNITLSAYTAYIIHPFFVVFGTYLVVRLPVDHLAKFIVLCPAAAISCFAVSDLVRRAPLLRRIL